MKKNIKTVLLIGVALLLCASVAGCSSANPEIGKWKLESMNFMGQEVKATDADSVMPGYSGSTIEFKSDGIYTMTTGDSSYDGSYKADGNNLTLEEGDMTITGEVSGNKLIIDLGASVGAEMTMTFTKA